MTGGVQKKTKKCVNERNGALPGEYGDRCVGCQSCVKWARWRQLSLIFFVADFTEINFFHSFAPLN